MFVKFIETDVYCKDTNPYVLPVLACEQYAFSIPKSVVPDNENGWLIGFEDCDGNRYDVGAGLLTDGSECAYIDRTAVAYFKVRYVAPFNCKADEIIMFDANARTDCAEGVASAVLAGGLPENFGAGLRAFYGTSATVGYGMRIANAQDYINFLLLVHAIPFANAPYYGTMTHLGGGVIKWEIPEADFITAFGHSPNEVKLSFCSNGTNLFNIEVLQDFTTCFTDDPNGLHGCGIAWARFTDTSNFPLQDNQSIIFTYKESECAPENAIIELRWDNPAAAAILNISDYLDWLILQSGGWIIDKFISGSDVYVYFNVGFARDVGVELCGGFFKFCGYSYGSGYGYNPPPNPLWAVTQPICCNVDKLCPTRYEYWFTTVCLPMLREGTRGRFFIAEFSILGTPTPIYYSNELRYDAECNSAYIRFKNKQNFAGQPYSFNPLFENRIRIGFLLREMSLAKKEVISQNSLGIIRKIYSQNLAKFAIETDYFDYETHELFRLALEHDEFEIFDGRLKKFVRYVCEGEYSVETPRIKPFLRNGRGAATLTRAQGIETNTYC